MTGVGTTPSVSVVVPTVGRPSLVTLLESLAASQGPPPVEVVVVDDRLQGGPLPLPDGLPVRVERGAGRGPAAARNVGWRACDPGVEWVAFLDDDVVVGDTWLRDLAADLTRRPEVGGVQGRIQVPLPPGRPTDWERGTKGLEAGWWITADMAYRLPVLERVGGFDERFPRAFREDADIALRVQRTGARLVRGRRVTTHPVRPVDPWVSVRVQAGNADDALMRRLHGPHWRSAAHAPAGGRSGHLRRTATAAVTVGCAVTGRRRAAATAGTAWLLDTARYAWSRIAPGPRSPRETATMVATSVAIPPVATWHWVRGLWRHRRAAPWTAAGPRTRAVLFDRDGTLVHDVPYNGDPDLVRPVHGAVDVVRSLRRRGVRTGVVTNQSGIAKGRLTSEQVAAVNARVDELFGGFDVWVVCPHDDRDACRCRKPGPGMVESAAAALGVPTHEVLVVGDIGADVHAAHAAGARGVLVPTGATRAEEVAAAPLVARDLADAVRFGTGVWP